MAVTEGLTWSGTDLNDGTNYTLRGVDFTPPAKRAEWVQGADADGAALVRDPLYENRVVTLRLRVNPAGSLTMDQALAKVGSLVDLCEEAEQQQDGTALLWTPAQGTKSFTLYVLSGEVISLPIEKDTQNSGYFLKAPMVELRLTCKPFGYGAAVASAATVTNTDPAQLLTLASVTGDVPAEGRLVVTDAATQSRRSLEWGLRQRYYDVATLLLIDSDSLTALGGTGTTRSGAYDPGAAGNSVIRGTLTTAPIAICSTGNQSHVGTYRVKARVYAAPTSDATADDFKVRLSWREGDGPLRSNTYTSPVAVNAWAEVDLGLVSIPEKTLGTQRWVGQVEAYSEDAGDTLDVDVIYLIPAGEGYGKGRAPVSFETPTAFLTRDEFDQTAGALGTPKAAPVGGNWAGAGDADDFAVNATDHVARRSVVFADADINTGRYVTLGSNQTAIGVQGDFLRSSFTMGIAGDQHRFGLLARYVDTNNWLMAVFNSSYDDAAGADAYAYWVKLVKRVAGTVTVLGKAKWLPSPVDSNWYWLRLVVSTDGNAYVWWAPRGTAAGAVAVSAQDSALATGGALATGKVGAYDAASVTPPSQRDVDNFYSFTATVDAAVFSGRAAEIRHDQALRQDSTGTYYGPIASYRGSRLLIPPAGSAARTSQVFVKARRNDIDVAQDDQIADSTTATVHYTPRYLVIPR